MCVYRCIYIYVYMHVDFKCNQQSNKNLHCSLHACMKNDKICIVFCDYESVYKFAINIATCRVKF